MPPEAEQQAAAAAPEAAAPEGPSTGEAAQRAAAEAAMSEGAQPTGDKAPVVPSADGTPQRGADGKFLPKDGAAPVAATTEAPAEEEGGSKIAAILRAREKAQEVRETAVAESEKLMSSTVAKAQAEADRIISEAKQRAEKEMGEWRTKLRTSPLQAIKDGGIDTRTLVDEVAREGTPEWQAQKRLEQRLDAIATENAELKAWRETQSKEQEAWSQRQATEARKQTENRFLTLLPEDSAARTLYEDSEIIAKAHAAADLYREKTGQVASLEDLKDYLEEQATKRLAGIRQQRVDTSAAPQAAKKSGATQPKANGPRALSAASANERRTSPKPFHELSETEQRAAQIEAAEAAMRG